MLQLPKTKCAAILILIATSAGCGISTTADKSSLASVKAGAKVFFEEFAAGQTGDEFLNSFYVQDNRPNTKFKNLTKISEYDYGAKAPIQGGFKFITAIPGLIFKSARTTALENDKLMLPNAGRFGLFHTDPKLDSDYIASMSYPTIVLRDDIEKSGSVAIQFSLLILDKNGRSVWHNRSAEIPFETASEKFDEEDIAAKIISELNRLLGLVDVH